jgi:pimeloyl-ACP methyl ester carboxylesterase
VKISSFAERKIQTDMSTRNYSITNLEIHGFQGRAVENRFFQQEGASETLAVIYPGLRYTSDMPLLYYTTELLTQRGSDVLQLWADYTSTDYQSLSQEQRAAWLREDGQSILRAGQGQRNYNELVMIGKSIGTLILAELIIHGEIPKITSSIWLTPLLHLQHVLKAAKQLRGPALFIGGGQDPSYTQEGVAQLRELPEVMTLTIEGANHSLEFPGDLPRSLRAMEEILQGITDFLDKSSR